MSITEAVLQNSPHHAQLLAQIAELDYVPPALKQQEMYIAALEKDLDALAPQIAELEKTTKKERKEHEALRDSTMRRLAAKITGREEKFAEKASKEEKEYIEALEKEMQQKRQREMLNAMVAKAKEVRADLQVKMEPYDKAQRELVALYSQIFDGPTQAYPEDDQLESQIQQAQDRYNEIQGFLNRESQAVGLLQAAEATLVLCNKNMTHALNYSQWDTYSSGVLSDLMTDLMERTALNGAEGDATQARILVEQAVQASPQVQPIGQLTIHHGSIIGDVLLDSVFSDKKFHARIMASWHDVHDLQRRLATQLELARGRVSSIGADLNGAADALIRARGALYAFRRSVFHSVSGGGSDLPAYASHPEAPVTMPRGPEDPASGSTLPTEPSNTPQIEQPSAESSSYSALLEPHPQGVLAVSPSAWSSRNPYAAALASAPPAPGDVPSTPKKTPAT
ncbi:hypothetical protein B0H14DRAFT_2795062 [Mycena olivaceomarginata]|nr:hypothetical protein B0H14DRAFT_2795062 [Mycena olivaceomarginata]